MKYYSYSKLSEYIYRFEDERFDTLRNFLIDNWLLWHVIKKPLFYQLLLDKKYTKTETKVMLAKIFTRLIHFAIFPFSLIKVLHKKPDSITFSNDIHKSEKSIDGKWMNFLIDPLIENLLKNNLNISISLNGKFRQPSHVKNDIISDGLLLPTALIKGWFFLKGKFRKESKQISEIFNLYFQSSSINLTVKAGQIEKILLDFYSEYIVYKSFFVLFKPKSIFFVDSIGTGRMAAAKKYGFKIFEMQHGLISKYKADYIISKKFKEVKRKMIIPNKIITFGDFFSEIIQRTGFWDQGETLSLGNFRMDKFRDLNKNNDMSNYIIVFPTQWHVFDYSKKLMIEFEKAVMANPKLNIYIKFHPFEPEDHIKWYLNKVKSQSDNFKYYTKDDNIYDLLLRANICIGFDSTTLLESLALGIPTLTIPTDEMPNGVHDYLPNNKLMDLLVICKAEDISNTILRFTNDDLYRKNWLRSCEKAGSYLYTRNYKNNLVSKLLAT